MFCGIGNPKEFENTLLKHKFKLQKNLFMLIIIILVMMNRFSKKNSKKNKLEIITTEKTI